MATIMRITLACGFAVLSCRAAEPFLQRQTDDNTTLLNSLESVLGAGSLWPRVNRLHERIGPLFQALPKNTRNQLSHASARYALHRIIVDMHGWSIEGLEPNVSTYNTTSLVGSGALKGVLSTEIEAIIQDKVGADGFSLHELAVLASTVEHGIHEQQQVILRRVCQLFGLPTLGAMSSDDMRMIIQMYEAVFLVGAGDGDLDLKKFSASDAKYLLDTAGEKYPGWEDTLLFVDDEIESLAFNERSTTNPFLVAESSLETAMRVVERAADHFARHLAELECQEIREDLLAFESADTGRIRLVDFYRASLTSRFFYVETKEYLQALGALDESDYLHGPKVIISNYVLAKVNCLAHSNSYSVCCINECDALYDNLEQGALGYESSPRHIASLVSAMSSSTVQAPRNLSQSLLGRLDEIAAVNGGSIMLHSRLFAQWMHQAFPRECAYPHLVGTTTSLSPIAWSQKNGVPYRVDHEGRETRRMVLNHTMALLDGEYAARLGEVDASADAAEEFMWTLDEETFVVPSQSVKKRFMSLMSSLGSHVFILMVVVVVALGAIYTKAGMVVRSNERAKLDAVFV